MSYLDQSLAEHERLLYRARFHWLHKLGAWMTLALFLAGAVMCLALGSGWAASLTAFLVATCGLGLFITMMLPMWTTEIGVTDQRFILKQGWLQRRTGELQLSSIEEVNLEQGVWGRLLDYGRIIMHGTGVNDITLPLLADPIGLRRALQEAMGAASAPAVRAAPHATGPQSQRVARA